MDVRKKKKEKENFWTWVSILINVFDMLSKFLLNYFQTDLDVGYKRGR